MPKFDFKKYHEKATKRQEWEGLVQRYGTEVAKIIYAKKAVRLTTPIVAADNITFGKTYRIPSKSEL